MLVPGGAIGVVTLRSRTGRQRDPLAPADQLVEVVVDGGQTDFGQPFHSQSVNLVRREMHMLAFEYLGDDPTLRRQPPAPSFQSPQQVARGYPLVKAALRRDRQGYRTVRGARQIARI